MKPVLVHMYDVRFLYNIIFVAYLIFEATRKYGALDTAAVVAD